MSTGHGSTDGRIAFIGLLVFTFVMLLSPQNVVTPLAALRPALLAAAVAIGAHLGHRFLRGGEPAPRARETWIAGALFAWAVATVPFSLWPGGSVDTLLGVYVKSLLIFWLIGRVVTTVDRVRTLFLALTAMAVPLAVTAVRHYRAGDFMQGVATTRIAGYDGALTENPNDLALMLNLLLPLAIALLLARPRPLVRVALLGAIAVNVVGVVATFSRAGFLTLAVIGLGWVWKLRRRPQRGWAYLALALALAAVPFLPGDYLARLGTMTDRDSDPTGSAQARWQDSRSAIAYIASHPFVGAGIGQDVLALNAVRGAHWTAVHNVYLEYAVDLGLPGAGLFVLLLYSTIRSAGRVERQAAQTQGLDPLALMAAGVQISLVAFAVAGLFHPASYQFYFYYIGGLAVALRTVWSRIARVSALAPAAVRA